MDIAKKKQEVLEDIARQPANVVFARIGIVCLRSATAAAFCKESTIWDFSAVNFISAII